MQLLELHDKDGATLRWVRRASEWEKNAAYIFGIFVAVMAMLVLRGNHVIMWGLIFADLMTVAIFVFVYSADYELALRSEAIVWGNTRQRQNSVPISMIESMVFYRRHDGTGAITMRAADINWMLPGDFTDLPGVSELLLQKVREIRDDIPLKVE